MENKETITWDEVLKNEREEKFIRLEDNVAKKLVIVKPRIEVVRKFNKEYEFVCDVVEEDGQPVSKIFTTTSGRCMKAIRNIIGELEEINPLEKMNIVIKKTGKSYHTQYYVAIDFESMI